MEVSIIFFEVSMDILLVSIDILLVSVLILLVSVVEPPELVLLLQAVRKPAITRTPNNFFIVLGFSLKIATN